MESVGGGHTACRPPGKDKVKNMDTATISQAADLIIVFCFAAVVGGTAGTVLGRFICWMAEKVIRFVKKHRKVTENE